jgi:hypothetical protein
MLVGAIPTGNYINVRPASNPVLVATLFWRRPALGPYRILPTD